MKFKGTEYVIPLRFETLYSRKIMECSNKRMMPQEGFKV
jgi:hypothetical protein